ncbi:AraC family transcriptional regulator [Flindersiella endophytica]
MDVLSSVIAAMRAGQPRSYQIEAHAPWGRGYAEVPGAGFHIVLQGSCWLLPSDGEPVHLTMGDVVLLPHGQRHGMADSLDRPLVTVQDVSSECERARTSTVFRLGPDEGEAAGSAPSCVMVCGMYQLDQARRHPLLDQLPEVIHMPARLGQHPKLRSAVDLLSGELQERQNGAEVVVPALLEVLLLLILRAWFADQPCREHEVDWAAAMRDPAISAALAGIHDYPERPWTVESLGAESGLSRAAFARRFTGLVGQPPLAYLTWWRMTAAALLLRQSDVPLSTIAQKVGYSSEFAFANAFKREFGVAPGHYRRGDLACAEPGVGQELVGQPAG